MVAPLHWGLGHATRCIPIIRALLQDSYEVLLASDGSALLLLRKEFPSLPFLELPSYNISYPKKGRNFKWKLLSKLPHIYKTMVSEKRLIAKMISEGKIDGIISDNRFGIYSSRIPSIYITHQLSVLTGSTTYISSKIHQNIIKKFDECWVPDNEGKSNLSGKLSDIKQSGIPVKYIGPFSRMQHKTMVKAYDILVIISGPEPQRTFFENILISALDRTEKKIMIVRGIIESDQKRKESNNLTLVNFMESDQLEEAINESELVISRSGYSTIMDLSMMGKKAFFIPTPGQYEQQYLAKRLQNLRIAPFCQQQDFNIEKLNLVERYKGFNVSESVSDFKSLFRLFQRE